MDRRAPPDYAQRAWPEPWLARRASLSPQREALVCGAERLSYLALHQRALALAQRLQAAGVQADEPVGLLLDSGVDLAVACHALRYCGAVLLPLNARLSAVEWGYQLGAAGARWLLHAAADERGQAARAAAATPPAALALAADQRLQVLGRPGALPLRSARDAGLLRGASALLFTSGTSGRPKGVVLGPENLLASAAAAASLLAVGASDRWLACLPLYHIGGLALLFRSCLAGGTLLLHRGFRADAVLRDLRAQRVTQLSLVATMLSGILAEGGGQRAPPGLRCVLLGGGPAPEGLLERALALGFPVAPTYGLTEAASQVATRPPGDDRRPLAGRLQPLPGVAVRIVADAGGAAAAPGQAGEIWLRGANVMRGYLGHAARQPGGWLHTGDLGALDEQGLLHVLDRRDDLIVSGGENVYPAEVEAVLEQHPAVAEAGVIGLPDARYGARPVAYWVPAPGCGAAGDLSAFCRERLGAFKVPVAFHRVAALPRNGLGKLLRRELRARAGASGAEEFVRREAEQAGATMVDFTHLHGGSR